MSDFIVDDATKHTEDSRVFRNGKCVYNRTLGFAYSVDEIVELFNCDSYYERVMSFMQIKIWYTQCMFSETGLEKYKYMENTLRELRKELYEPEHYNKKYGKMLTRFINSKECDKK